MGSHIFVVSKPNFDTCMKQGLYGGMAHANERVRSEIIAGFKGMKEGDFVFFYVRGQGLYGLWKTAGHSFYDETPVWVGEEVFPYRVRITPTLRHFPRPVELSDIYDLRDKGKIWTFDLGIIARKSHYPITTDESKEFIRLLLRNNPVFEPTQQASGPCQQTPSEIVISYETSSGGHLNYEGYLNAWFMNAFACGKLKDFLGEYRDFLNYVPTSFNTVMDIFLTHVTTVDDVDVLHKFTCMELKTGVCNIDNLEQLVKYEDWLARKLVSGDSEMVQSILVGYDFRKDVMDYVRQRAAIEKKTVRLVQYRVNATKDDLELISVSV